MLFQTRSGFRRSQADVLPDHVTDFVGQGREAPVQDQLLGGHHQYYRCGPLAGQWTPIAF